MSNRYTVRPETMSYDNLEHYRSTSKRGLIPPRTVIMLILEGKQPRTSTVYSAEPVMYQELLPQGYVPTRPLWHNSAPYCTIPADRAA